MRWRGLSLSGLLGWLVVLIGFVMGSRPISDNSLFTHLATGRLILEDGIPRSDPYSFTAPGEPWVVQSWLVSALYAVVERLGGVVAVRLVAGLLVATLLGLAWRLTRASDSPLVRMGLLVLVAGAGAPFWSPRPLLVGLVLLALLLIVTTEERDPRLAVPIMWVWVNSHGSFPLGGLAVATMCLGRFLDERGERPAPAGPADRATALSAEAGSTATASGPWRTWRPLGWVAVGTLVGAVGPLGPRLLVFPVQLLGRMEILGRVVEWRSPSFDQLHARVFLVQVAVAILVLVRRPTFRAAVPLVVFTAVALAGQRSIPAAGLVLLPGMATGLAGLGRLSGATRRPVHAVAAVALTVLALLAIVPVVARPSLDLSTYPVDALAWLEANGVLEQDRRLLAQDTTGNLIELWRGTDSRVFLDDRYDLFPLDVTRDYLELNDATSRWADVLDDRGVEYVLWPRTSPLAGLLASSPHWRVRYQDPTHLVACRRGTGPEGEQC